MKSNLSVQQQHYNDTRKKLLDRYRNSPDLLKGITRPMPYFIPNTLIEHEIICEFQKKPHIRMLELGCGDGHWAAYWASQGFDITFLDSSTVNVSIASLRTKVNNFANRAHPLVGSATNLPCADDSFDLIIGFGIIHHLTSNEEEHFWGEVKRVLKPGGKAYFMESLENSQILEFTRTLVPITQKNDPRPSRFSKDYLDYVLNDPHPKRENTTRHYDNILMANGFDFTYEEIGFFSRLDRLTTNLKIRSIIHSLDYKFFKHVPFIRYFSRNIILKIVNPL